MVRTEAGRHVWLRHRAVWRKTTQRKVRRRCEVVQHGENRPAVHHGKSFRIRGLVRFPLGVACCSMQHALRVEHSGVAAGSRPAAGGLCGGAMPRHVHRQSINTARRLVDKRGPGSSAESAVRSAAWRRLESGEQLKSMTLMLGL